MSTSERASALVRPMQRDRTDRDILREEWRLKAKEAAKADALASELKEGKSILLDEMIIRLREGEPGLSDTRAERIARTSQQFKEYVRKMHNAHREAQDLRIECENLNRIYWEAVSADADERAEKRMTR